jgi:hypothetical protein
VGRGGTRSSWDALRTYSWDAKLGRGQVGTRSTSYKKKYYIKIFPHTIYKKNYTHTKNIFIPHTKNIYSHTKNIFITHKKYFTHTQKIFSYHNKKYLLTHKKYFHTTHKKYFHTTHKKYFHTTHKKYLYPSQTIVYIYIYCTGTPYIYHTRDKIFSSHTP